MNGHIKSDLRVTAVPAFSYFSPLLCLPTRCRLSCIRVLWKTLMALIHVFSVPSLRLNQKETEAIVLRPFGPWSSALSSKSVSVCRSTPFFFFFFQSCKRSKCCVSTRTRHCWAEWGRSLCDWVDPWPAASLSDGRAEDYLWIWPREERSVGPLREDEWNWESGS